MALQSKKRLKLSGLTVSVLSIFYSQAGYSQTAGADVNKPITTLQTLTFHSDDYSNAEQQETVSHDSSTKARQANLISNYLSTVAGVTVGGTSALDQHIYIRGLGSDNTGSALKITVDGVRQPETRGFHHAGISGLDPDLYKSTEVEVGNNSVTLGNNAVGGGVAFTTVDAGDLLRLDQKIGAKVKVGYGSNDSQLHGTVTTYAKPNDKVDLLLSYGERQSDGGEDGKGRRIQGDDISIQNILAKASFMPSDGHKLTASFTKYDNAGKYPFRPNLGYQSNLPDNIQDGYSKNETYSLGYDFTPSDNFSLNTKIYHLENSSLSQGKRGADFLKIATEGETDGINLFAKQKVEQTIGSRHLTHLLSYGVEGYKKSATLVSSDITEDATSIGAYLQDRIDFGRVVLTPGIRFDHYKPSERLSKDNYNEVSGALAGEFKLTDNTTLFASYTELFNGPPLPETINQSGQTFVSDDVKAETGANKEIGFTTRFNNLLASNDKLNFTAKAFNTDYDNKINRVTGIDCNTGKAVTGGQCASYINAGTTTYKGYEISSDYRLGKTSLTAGYAHAESETAQSYQLGKDSGDQLNFGFKYNFGNQNSIGTNIRHVASLGRRTSATAVTNLPSFTVYDVFGSYHPRQLPNVSLDAGIYNLTDENYVEHTSNTTDYAMGRNVKVALSYHF